MDVNIILVVAAAIVVSITLTYFLTKRKFDRQLESYKSISDAISESKTTLSKIEHSINQEKNYFLN
ncbi:hypothetical protein [Pelagibaculum spongiae]|uniref:Uncharacterized protein n=1 Tax=Pelagibaculum spongiae TaxID=2080658 RepID=A0A2V1H2T5_9GAMM|nr:hypothetical protein [Pelagibaculum spongiae]PVZ71528.1 hypothetical protein DC094_00310 [Pelagibaculum spongiae]